jgi:plasmid stabilization system protein ParE
LDEIRKLASNPDRNTRPAKFEKLRGDYRSVLVWNYRVYFKVEEERISILDIILDLGSQASI